MSGAEAASTPVAPVEPVALVVAKAPVPGQVKTRLGDAVGHHAAAWLAAAALLDTLAVCTQTFGAARCHLALSGAVADGVAAQEVTAALSGWTLHDQRGEGLGARLAHAHRDAAAAAGVPVVQVGMDTPHLDVARLREVTAALGTHDAALGPARDGGWWVLGLRSPAWASVLCDVATSTVETGRLTHEALVAAGARVASTTALRDVDTVEDAAAVAALAPATRFAAAWRDLVADQGALA